MNVQESSMILATLLMAYPTTSIQDGTEYLWADDFENVPFEVVAAAVKEYIHENPFWPAISEIRRIIRVQRESEPTPYIPLDPGQKKPTIRRREYSPEELEKMRTERRYILDGLKAGRTWDELSRELGRTAEDFDA